jgi:hypothetical protein
MWWAEPVPDMGERRNAYRMLVGKLVGKETLGRPKRRLDDHIKTVLMEMRRDENGAHSSDSGQRQGRAVVNMVMNFQGFLQCAVFLE